jgi:segregation and condensation protein A
MLLPKGHAAVADDADDDAMDPRWELVHQLLQYKKFKEAAGGLAALAQFEQDKLPRRVVEQSVSEGDRPLKPVDRIELWNAFNIVLRRLAEKLVVGEIRDEQVTVSDQMESLLQRLQTTKSFVFSDLFPNRTTLRVLVATFLAVLELTRLRKLAIRQDDAFTDIICTAVEDTAPQRPRKTHLKPRRKEARCWREQEARQETSLRREAAGRQGWPPRGWARR